jgi:hypothetical protein
MMMVQMHAEPAVQAVRVPLVTHTRPEQQEKLVEQPWP